MLVIGLTGGIGSGKSTVANLFQAMGATIIDTDQLARDVVQRDMPAYIAITQKFGQAVLSSHGELDRKALREIIFADLEAKQWLENLLHPLIREEIARQVLESQAPYCLVVIPLLFETAPNPLLNRILVVDAEEKLQLQRTASRDQVSIAHIKAIINTQVTRETRLFGADDIIYNDKDISHLSQQVATLHGFYLSLC